MDTDTDLIYAAAGRRVLALDRFTGRPVWQIKMPGGFFASGITTLAVRANELYAARGGYLYCLDRHSGEVLWERGLKAGSGTVILALGGLDDASQQAAAATHAAQQQGAAVAAGVAAAGGAAAAAG
ncbi:MAG TPA: PQQ-binding-like beta-propeller repeat protein [Phycisphaerales bacterium]|nr:PQQ-binding-like beta-propeller repeat protein [Phycisphaerales bacterium]